jgi:predicted Rossmann fold nucleotide-binding protein DprA/Smf involved in DNA uptake
MQTEIIITNTIQSGTGFAVIASDMTEGVFIPSKLMHETSLRPGDRVSAMLVPNHTRPDKTPWVAISFDKASLAPVSRPDTLAELIIDDLEDGRATVEEIAENLNMSDEKIAAKLAELVASGDVVRLTCFDLPEDVA